MLIISGDAGSGKSALSSHAEASYGYESLRVSALIEWYAQTRHLSIKQRLDYLYVHQEMRRQFGDNFVSDVILSCPSPRKLVDGLRVPHHVGRLQKTGDAKVIALECPQDIRFQRVLGRAAIRDPQHLSDFQYDDMRANEGVDMHNQNVGEIMKMADFIIDASGTLEETQYQFDEIVERLIA